MEITKSLVRICVSSTNVHQASSDYQSASLSSVLIRPSHAKTTSIERGIALSVERAFKYIPPE